MVLHNWCLTADAADISHYKTSGTVDCLDTDKANMTFSLCVLLFVSCQKVPAWSLILKKIEYRFTLSSSVTGRGIIIARIQNFSMFSNHLMDQNDKWVTFFSPLPSSLSEAVYSRLEWELGWRAKTATRDSDLSDGWSKRSFWKQLKTCQQLQGRGMHVYITFLPQQV